MTTLLHQLRFEQKVFWRSREAAVFVFIFPLLLYALLGSVYGEEIDGIPAEDVLLVGLFGYGAATTAFGGLAIILVVRREAGTLKRLRATPLAPPVYLMAVLLSTLTTFALQSVALLALGGLGFGASMPRNWLGFAGAIVLGVASFAGLGFGAAALIRSAEGVSAVVNVVILPMAFLSGSFGPTADFRRRCRRSPTFSRSPTSSTSPTACTSAATRSSPTRRRSRSCSHGASPASSSRCVVSAGRRASASGC